MKDLDVMGLKKTDAQDCNRWRAALLHHTSLYLPECGK